MLAAGVVLRCVQLQVLSLGPESVESAGLRIRINERSSREAVPTVHSLKNPGTVCACNSSQLGSVVPAGLCRSVWCQLGTDARDCLYLALNGHVLRARYTSPAF